jgi:hypothetical protein
MSHEPQSESFDDTGVPRSSEEEWAEYTYPPDRRDGVERSADKKRGCASTLGLAITFCLLSCIVLYAMAITLARLCVEIHEFVIK